MRLLTQIMQGGDLVIGETTLLFQFPGDVVYIFSKEEHPHFLAFTTPEGLNYRCDGCHGWHIVFWRQSDYQQAPDMPGLQHAPANIRALWKELHPPA